MVSDKYENKGDILVVDDHLDNVRLIADMLSDSGYEVRQVLNGHQALKVIEYEPPELVLLDIMMPNMNGYEVCEKLKQSPASKDIPIIFLSAKTHHLDKVKAFELGGVDYITKPFFLSEVLCRVQTHLKIYRHEQSLAQEITQKEKAQAELKEANQKLKEANQKLAEVNQKLKQLVNLDGLTQIANRCRFDEYLSSEWHRLKREKLPLSLIMTDVDYFKYYNDRYGHLAGDDCLKNIAQTINRVIKRPADLVARYGGEEFAIILPNTPLLGATEVAANICREMQRLAMPHEKSKVSPYVTLSLGIATLIPDQTLSSLHLIDMADKALFQAKKEGRNCFVLSSSQMTYTVKSLEVNFWKRIKALLSL